MLRRAELLGLLPRVPSAQEEVAPLSASCLHSFHLVCPAARAGVVLLTVNIASLENAAIISHLSLLNHCELLC